MTGTVLVLGANGRFGRVAAQAFAGAGWDVVAQSRRAPVEAPGARTVPLVGAVTDTAQILAAAPGAAVVVHALNPLYTDWDTQAWPINETVIGIARALGATLMFPGNVYNFGSPMPAELTEQTPQHPSTARGALRSRMEAAVRAGAPRSIVVRAGDFFGGRGSGSWMDQAIVKDLARARITYPGPLHLAHAWAYLPDLARAFVLLAEGRDRLPPHDSFHFPGHAPTGEELVAAIVRAARRCGLLAAGQDPITRTIPWPLVRLAGIFSPMPRELARMSYLWREPHRLSGDKLERFVGTVPHTALDDAVDAALLDLGMARRGPKAAS